MKIYHLKKLQLVFSKLSTRKEEKFIIKRRRDTCTHLLKQLSAKEKKHKEELKRKRFKQVFKLFPLRSKNVASVIEIAPYGSWKRN